MTITEQIALNESHGERWEKITEGAKIGDVIIFTKDIDGLKIWMATRIMNALKGYDGADPVFKLLREDASEEWIPQHKIYKYEAYRRTTADTYEVKVNVLESAVTRIRVNFPTELAAKIHAKKRTLTLQRRRKVNRQAAIISIMHKRAGEIVREYEFARVNGA